MESVEMDEQLLHLLLQEQHPDLAELPVHLAATGWDNQLWRLGDTLAVRVPRTERAPSLLRKEHEWVPILARRLPLPVPIPVRIGEASEQFPLPWIITTWVPGEPADRAPITRGRHAAETLADFLRALHQAAPHDAPVNWKRGVALRALTEEFERKCHSLGPDGDVLAIGKIWDEAISAPEWHGPPTWFHGDLHPANVVVSEGSLSGVLDFGELGAGDPATDLAAAWLLLPANESSAFFENYAAADDAMIQRARGWAVFIGVSLIGIGQAWERGLPGGQPTWGRAGRNTLNRVLRSS
ncbi:aminoglycoside phosphotransferase family protein [Nocardia abscessus]|uniref:aminoglycoside phosphotransferase family protein n=1 Tax=Nocardia abscessus TaxID=120957 RepID=UPI002457AEB1|nr:aminoglycoside phosphotransferase family protein [Nocardia abscessus]